MGSPDLMECIARSLVSRPDAVGAPRPPDHALADWRTLRGVNRAFKRAADSAMVASALQLPATQPPQRAMLHAARLATNWREGRCQQRSYALSEVSARAVNTLQGTQTTYALPDGPSITASFPPRVSPEGQALLAALPHAERSAATSMPMAAHPTKPHLALGAFDGRLAYWDLTTTPPTRHTLESRHTAEVHNEGYLVGWFTGGAPWLTDGLETHSLCFTPDGAMLAAGDQDGAVSLWDLRGAKPREVFTSGSAARIPTLAADRVQLVAVTDSALVVWDFDV